jgi:tRNA 2-thiouridine synthesizing protein E
MAQYKINAQDSETSSQYASIRQAELIDQNWNRTRSTTLAANEGFELTDQHWQVISYLREQYLAHGLPRFARTTARALNKQYAAQGGNKYLHNLFPGGPVTQGSRLTIMRYSSKCTPVHQAMTSDVIYRRYRNVTTKR